VSADFFGRVASPANRALAGSVSRSSTWETRRVPVSFSASSDNSHDTAGTTRVPGYPACLTKPGRSRATRSGTVSSSPASRVSARAGKAAKSIIFVLGRRVSRPAVAGLVLASAAGSRSSRPKPSSARISPTPVRLSGTFSAASWALISYTDRPCRRSAITRARAASFFGARLRPGLPGSANNVNLPARKSRTRERSAEGV
jgi:hypothetical protein